MHRIQRIDEIIEQGSLLKHRFYTMWSEGRLDIPMLAGYSREYYQLVKAVPRIMEHTMEYGGGDTLNLHLQEEYQHIPLWEEFAAGLGVPRNELKSYPGLPKTREAVCMLEDSITDYYTGAAVLYALEKEIPRISSIKLEGLGEFYGIRDESTTEYFVEHMAADIRHAESWLCILEDAVSDDTVSAAEKSVAAQNLLLDACYEGYCQ